MFHYARFLSLLFLVTATAHAQEWTRFRGPNGTGISDTKGLSLMEKAQKCWTSLNGVVFHCAISSLLQISAP